MSRSSGPDCAALWRERLARHGRLEQSTADFCAAEGVSVASFYAWRRKLGLATPRPAKTPSKGAFQQLVISENSAAVSVRLPGGIVLEVAAGQEAALRAVVAELVRAIRQRAGEASPC